MLDSIDRVAQWKLLTHNDLCQSQHLAVCPAFSPGITLSGNTGGGGRLHVRELNERKDHVFFFGPQPVGQHLSMARWQLLEYVGMYCLLMRYISNWRTANDRREQRVTLGRRGHQNWPPQRMHTYGRRCKRRTTDTSRFPALVCLSLLCAVIGCARRKYIFKKRVIYKGSSTALRRRLCISCPKLCPAISQLGQRSQRTRCDPV